MKRYVAVVNVLLIMLILAGCKDGSDGRRTDTTELSNMDVMIAANASEEDSDDVTAETESDSTDTTTAEINYEYFYYPTTELSYDEEELTGEPDPDVDIDLTVMGPNMIYAQINNMMMDPDSYLGKIIKIKGEYYSYFYEETGNYYHYVLIKDALACCQNGMEFIWDEGQHTFPDEYPEENQTIIICGEMKCYTENEYIYYYLDIDDYSIYE